jgi:Protein of unknown function (DUF2442)
MHLVRKINYIEGYKISLTFNDKKTKLIDIQPYLKKDVFLPLKDFEYFKMVKVKNDTITWPNEADFCPDVLYKIGIDISEEKKPKKTQSKGKRKTG